LLPQETKAWICQTIDVEHCKEEWRVICKTPEAYGEEAIKEEKNNYMQAILKSLDRGLGVYTRLACVKYLSNPVLPSSNKDMEIHKVDANPLEDPKLEGVEN